MTWWSLVFQARGHTLGWLEQSDSRVESTSQSLKNQVESTSHTWSLWVVLALVLRSGCACLLVMFIFSYVLIANWILGKEFFIWWRTMQVKFLNFTLFGTPFRFSVLHSLIPFKLIGWVSYTLTICMRELSTLSTNHQYYIIYKLSVSHSKLMQGYSLSLSHSSYMHDLALVVSGSCLVTRISLTLDIH